MFAICCTSIRNQIFFLIFLMACLPLSIIISDAFRQYQHDKNESVALASSVAQQIKNYQDTLLSQADQLVSSLSVLPPIQNHDSSSVNTLLTKLIKTNPNYVEITMLDRSGAAWASAIPSKIGESYASRHYFKQVIATGKVSVSEYADEKERQVPVITVAFPITNPSGAVTDVCSIVLSLEKYHDFYVGEHSGLMSLVLLTDHNGTILYSSAYPKLIGKQDRSDLFNKMTQGSDTGTFEASGNLGINRVLAYQKIYLKGETTPYLYIRTGLSKQHILHNVYHDLTLNIGTLLTAVFLVLGLAIFICKKGILNKIAVLQNSMQKISQGDLEISCSNATSTNELDQLGCSLTAMSQQLKNTDEALKQSIQNYRELVENASSIILKWDTEGKILFYNEYAEKFFGFSNSEILGKSLIGTIVPETESSGQDLAEMLRNIALNPEEYLNNENENTRKDGERVWISWNNRALTGADGSKLGILSVGQDITTRKWMEQELRRSEERFRSFVENVNNVIFALTPEGVFSYVSPQWKIAFGYETNETIGMPFARFVHPDDVQACFEFLQKVIVTGQKQSGIEYRVRCKDGTFLYYKANGALIQDPENLTFTFIGIGRDITERKTAENLLRLSEEKFSAAFRATPDAVILSRLSDGNLLEVNEGFTSLTGYTPDEVIGKNGNQLNLWLDSEKRTRFFQELKEHKIAKDIEAQFRRNDGTLLVGQISARVLEINGELYVLSITRDITEREQTQKELIKAQKLESLGVLAGGIAHNFNNVLTGVIGYISYAKKHLNDPEKVLPILESAEKASYRAASLARQLLTFSKGSTPNRKPVLIDTLIQESLSLFLSGSNVKGIIDCSSGQTIYVDSQQINQAFNNIVLNALQAMPSGGILTVRSEAVVLTTGNTLRFPPATYARIVFEDTGCGIKNDDLVKIFDPYFTTKENGTGLGLSTTHSIINKHGGYIDISSRTGSGAIVTVLLPTSEEVQQVIEQHNKCIKTDKESVSILVMDDEEIIRKLAKEILGDLGYNVITCSCGEEAIDLFKTSIDSGTPFSVVIMDLVIPGGMGGIETAQHILKLAPQTRLIACSGYSNDPAIAEYGAYGFYDTITKPYNAEELIRTLQNALIV